MAATELRNHIKGALAGVFRSRLKGIVLYGSEARGDASADSDVDVLVLLDGAPDDPADSWACIDALYPLVLEYGRPIHAEPVAMAAYESQEFPLYLSAAREGVTL